MHVKRLLYRLSYRKTWDGESGNVGGGARGRGNYKRKGTNQEWRRGGSRLCVLRAFLINIIGRKEKVLCRLYAKLHINTYIYINGRCDWGGISFVLVLHSVFVEHFCTHSHTLLLRACDVTYSSCSRSKRKLPHDISHYIQHIYVYVCIHTHTHTHTYIQIALVPHALSLSWKTNTRPAGLELLKTETSLKTYRPALSWKTGPCAQPRLGP